MISNVLKDFMIDVFIGVSEETPTFIIKEINHNSAKNKCIIYDREIGMCFGNYDTQRKYVFDKTDGYNSNSRNEVRLYFCTGEDYVQYQICVGFNILKDFHTNSKMFVEKSYDFNDYREFTCQFLVTEETLDEHGRENIINLLVNETVKVLNSIEEQYNSEKIQKYAKIVEKCKENKAKTNSLITSLLNGETIQEVKVTKDIVINQICNTDLTQEQINSISRIVGE